jgi:hypothetical protein
LSVADAVAHEKDACCASVPVFGGDGMITRGESMSTLVFELPPWRRPQRSRGG